MRQPIPSFIEHKYLFILEWLDLSRSKALQGFIHTNACTFLLAFP
nr:MAG TPA: hypothetical protein [Caudoviricetes sp.]